MPSAEKTIIVDSPASDIFAIISDLERYPEFMDNVKKVEVLQDDSGQSISRWTSELDGRLFKWTERDFVKPEENRIDFDLVEGDLKEYGGFWQLNETESGTSVTFNIYMELGVPMLAMFLNPIITRKLRENVDQMLSDLENATKR
ncbi:MAG: SRPBCC family protein [Rubrobacteridae bacterium]|nr:SRPBCC family protein [Rubrobacteridae bacterium]